MPHINGNEKIGNAKNDQTSFGSSSERFHLLGFFLKKQAIGGYHNFRKWASNSSLKSTIGSTQRSVLAFLLADFSNHS